MPVHLRLHDPRRGRGRHVNLGGAGPSTSAWSEGQELPERRFGPVTATDIVRYQGASGDMNPMHHDDAMARQAGYPEAFSVGMLHAGYLATYCTSLFGPTSVRRFRTRFKELVWRGDVLVAGGAVTSVGPGGQAGVTRVEVDLWMRTGDGRTAIEGSAAFDLEEQP